MEDIHVIDSLEALRAFSDPMKLQIIDGLRGEPRTASQIAKNLGEKPTKLYYHVTELERCGLITVAETRQKGNLVEKYYKPAANFYRVDTALFEKGPEALGAFYQNVSGMLEQSAVMLRSSIEAGTFTEKEAASSKRLLIRSRLSPADAEEFSQRLDALLQEFGQRASPDAEQPVSLTLLFYTEQPAR